MLKRDWHYLVDVLKITESPQYLHHNGLPLVSFFGLGFNGQDIDPEEAMDLIEFFQSNEEPKYRATVMGGVPSDWRTLTRDSQSDPEWANVYRSLDVISPWSVGRYLYDDGIDRYKNKVIKPDLVETAAHGIDYMPVVWPGFSWKNLMAQRGEIDPFNAFPRNGGRFYWRQVYNAISAGADMLYVAMFDEVDEGTAMFKLVTTSEQLPEGEILVPLDIDGYNLPSDWYLLLGGATGEMFRGEIPLSPEIPIALPP